MPEGDSLYWFAAKVGRALQGKVIKAARSHGPGPVPQVHRIVGTTCTGARSQRKNMLISFDNGLVLRGHLRMYGTWHVYQPGQAWEKPEHQARLVLEAEGVVVVNFNAPVIELLEERALQLHRPVAGLGPDLVADDFDAEEAFRRLRDPSRARLTIGDAVMDQTALAGAGNIWKHESLFHTGINPWRLVSEIDDETLRLLVDKAQNLMRAGVKKSNNLNLRHRPSMFVYGRAGQSCRRCYARIRSAPQGIDIRHTAYCPVCQPVVEGQATLPKPRVHRPR